jgi:hypothetical protein
LTPISYIVPQNRSKFDPIYQQFPGQDEWGVAFPVGETKSPIDKRHGRALVFYPEAALVRMGRLRVGVVFASLPPAFHGGEERLYTAVGGMGVQLFRGVPAHEVLRTQPDSLVPDGAPKGGDGLAVEPPALAGQFIHLFTCAEMNPA